MKLTITKKQLVAMTGVAVAIGAPLSFADGTAPDFSSMIAGVASGTAVSAIVAMGVIKLGPNFAKWATNKVASFF